MKQNNRDGLFDLVTEDKWWTSDMSFFKFGYCLFHPHLKMKLTVGGTVIYYVMWFHISISIYKCLRRGLFKVPALYRNFILGSPYLYFKTKTKKYMIKLHITLKKPFLKIVAFLWINLSKFIFYYDIFNAFCCFM